MIETADIKLHTWTCDVPGCVASEEVADIYGMGGGPTNWTTVKLSEGDGLVLCPDHAEYKPVLRTFLLVLDRRGAEVGADRP